jgi:3-mercaptopyruvate sulfurtransferase SseA
LRAAGHRDVLVLRGGMVDWQRDAAGANGSAPIGAQS